MAELTRHGAPTGSVFDLLGVQENDLTAALGFALSRSPVLLRTLVPQLWPAASAAHIAGATLDLEVHAEVGRTDLQISLGDALVIVEAKRNWLLPSENQLRRYAPRIHARGAGVLVTLSQASDALARTRLPTTVDGIPVLHLSWKQVLDALATAARGTRGHERFWLDEFSTYLKGVVRMRTPQDSRTYCVVISNGRPGRGGERTYRQYVEDEHVYFHGYGISGWPTEPPNFMAFRWNGAVQRIHRVMKADVIPSLLERWPDIPATDRTDAPHAVYELGPRLPPYQPIPNGAQYRASRRWVLLDQLQTGPTLAAAIAGSKALTVSQRFVAPPLESAESAADR